MKPCHYKFTIVAKTQIISVKICGKVCFVAVGQKQIFAQSVLFILKTYLHVQSFN